jgi:hypothetical protein
MKHGIEKNKKIILDIPTQTGYTVWDDENGEEIKVEDENNP